MSYPILLYHILSYNILSYPILSYHILSYNILSYPILSYPILSYPILSYPIVSYPILSYSILSYHILSYSILSCHIASLPISPNDIRSYYNSLHFRILWCIQVRTVLCKYRQFSRSYPILSYPTLPHLLFLHSFSTFCGRCKYRSCRIWWMECTALCHTERTHGHRSPPSTKQSWCPKCNWCEYIYLIILSLPIAITLISVVSIIIFYIIG